MFPIYLKDDRFEEPDDPIYYLVTRDGLFQVKRNPLFHARTKVRGLSWLSPEQEAAHLQLPPIPSSLLAEIVSFFREVFEVHRAEAVVLLYFNREEGRYKLKIPKQQVAGGHCRYEIGPTPAGWLRVGTIHSHASADAFHSELDDEDERHDDGLHMTIGNLDGEASVVCSLVVDGRRFTLKPSEVFEGAFSDFTGVKVSSESLQVVDIETIPRDSDAEGRPSSV
jgi:PRTRC genetic system protein A